MPLNPDGTWSNENTGYDQNYFNDPVVPNQVDPSSTLPTDYSDVGSDFLYDTLGLGSIDYLNNKSAAIAYSDWGPADKNLGENLVTHDVDSMVGEGFGGHSVDDYMYSDDLELNPWLKQYDVDSNLGEGMGGYDVDTGKHDPSLLLSAIENQTGITKRDIPDWRKDLVYDDPVVSEESVVGAEGGDTPVVAGADGEPPVNNGQGSKKGTERPYGWKPGQGLIDFASNRDSFQYELM